MSGVRVWREAGDAAAAAGRRVANARASTVAAAVGAAFPGIAASSDDGRIVLHGPGLLGRVFGTRRRAADPRLQALLTTGDER